MTGSTGLKLSLSNWKQITNMAYGVQHTMNAITMTNVCLSILFRTSDCFLDRIFDDAGVPVGMEIE